MPPITEAWAARYAATAAAQRDRPESAMLRVQRAVGGGVLNVVAEHGGDVIHRMNEWMDSDFPMEERITRGLHVVQNKLEKVLRWLDRGNKTMLDVGLSPSATDFRKEHADNMNSNADYLGVPREEYKAKVRAALQEYAREHAALEVYNEPQRLAREAAVALGEERFDSAARAYGKLWKLAQNEEAWIRAMEPDAVDPMDSTPATERMAGVDTRFFDIRASQKQFNYLIVLARELGFSSLRDAAAEVWGCSSSKATKLASRSDASSLIDDLIRLRDERAAPAPGSAPSPPLAMAPPIWVFDPGLVHTMANPVAPTTTHHDPTELHTEWKRLYYGQPQTRDELRAFMERLDGLSRAEITALHDAARAAKLTAPFVTTLLRLRERYDGARRWVRKEFLRRADGGTKNITIGTRVVLVDDQPQYAKTTQGPVSRTMGAGVVESAGDDRAKEAVGTTRAMRVHFDPTRVEAPPVSAAGPTLDAFLVWLRRVEPGAASSLERSARLREVATRAIQARAGVPMNRTERKERGYGTRGGEGPTAGREAATYEATLPDGRTVRAKSYFVHTETAHLRVYRSPDDGQWKASGIMATQEGQSVPARRVARPPTSA